MHPYPPVQDTSPFSRSFDWPQAGAADLGRIEQALVDGFSGTQWFHLMPINLDEAGEQTDVKTSSHSGAYTYSSPTDNVTPISEQEQANNYVQLAQIAECSNLVTSVFYFPLIDETDILGFQSGQLYSDGAHKASYDAMKSEIAASDGGQCHGSEVPTVWSSNGVAGAAASLVGPKQKPALTATVSFTVTADEDANYELTVTHDTPSGTVTDGTYSGTVSAYRTVTVRVPTAGSVGAVNGGQANFVLSAALNPSRIIALRPISFEVGSGSSGQVVNPSLTGSPSSFSDQDPVPLVRQILALLAIPNFGGLTTAQPLLTRLTALLGRMAQSGKATISMLAVDPSTFGRSTFSAEAKPKKGKLPSLKFRFTKGKPLRFPKLGRIPAGSYRMQIVLTGTSGAKLILKTAPFSVDAKGRLKKLTGKAKPKKAKPAHKAAKRPKAKVKEK
jgi:hypothetical protein